MKACLKFVLADLDRSFFRAANLLFHTAAGNEVTASRQLFLTVRFLKDKAMQILLINNDGGGFADHITMTDGMTIERLFLERLPHADAADYLVRVNRQPVTAG